MHDTPSYTTVELLISSCDLWTQTVSILKRRFHTCTMRCRFNTVSFITNHAYKFWFMFCLNYCGLYRITIMDHVITAPDCTMQQLVRNWIVPILATPAPFRPSVTNVRVLCKSKMVNHTYVYLIKHCHFERLFTMKVVLLFCHIPLTHLPSVA